MKNIARWFFNHVTRAELVLYGCLSFAALVGLGAIFAQTQIGGGGSSSGSGITYVTSNPGTCTLGTTFYNTTTGQSLYCTATNVLAFGTYTTSLNELIVSPNCPTASSTFCIQVADDGQIVSDATFTNASHTINITGTDPPFQCPGGTYPCTSATSGCSTPAKNCDVGKKIQATYGCDSISPGNCFDALDTTTISGITSATVATAVGTTLHASGVNNNMVAWATNDNAALAAAYDACGISLVPCSIKLPCGNMFFDHGIFTPVRITRGPHGIGIKGCGVGDGTVLIPAFAFTSGGGPGVGMFAQLKSACGQSAPNQSCIDSMEDVTFNGIGVDVNPGDAAIPTTPFALVQAGAFTEVKNVVSRGYYWNVANGFPIYGHECNSCTWINNLSYASGNFGCHFTNSNVIGNGMAVLSGFCNSSAFTGCVIDGSGYVVTVGAMCGFPLGLNYGGNTNDQYGAAVWVTAGQWTSYGDSLQGGVFVTGTGSVVMHNTYVSHDANQQDGVNMASSGTVSLCNVTFSGFSGTQWLTQSTGTVYDSCPNFGLTGAAVISGGNLAGDASTAGTVCAAGNFAITQSGGFGTTAAVTSVRGGSRKCIFTITNSGTTQGANPTVTFTFPVVFTTANNLTCTASVVGGNQTLAVTNLFYSGTPTKTAVIYTYEGTPTVNDTEIVVSSCDIP